MTGPEHYREAENLIRHFEYDADDPDTAARDIARAQVHATLALAEAYIAGAVMRPEDHDEWDRATGRFAATGESL